MPRRKFSCDSGARRFGFTGGSAHGCGRQRANVFVGTRDSAKRRSPIVTFLQADDGFPNRLVWYMECCNREDAAPYCGLTDSLQNSAVSQKNVVWVGYDLLAVRTRRI